MRWNYEIMWDYPSFPLCVYRLSLKRISKVIDDKSYVTYAYYKFSKKTIERINKMFKICDAFSNYLENKKTYYIVKDRERDLKNERVLPNM